MQGGTPRGDHISTEAGRQAPSVATVMDGPEAASVREKGGKPVPAETVQDDHIMGLQIDVLLDVAWYLVALDVHIHDSVRTALVLGGIGGLHLGGQEEVP